MLFIESSKDILYIVIAFCFLGLTFFLSWFIYYLVMIMSQLFKIIKEMRERIHKVDEVIKTIKEKIEHSSSYLMLISEGVKKLVEVVKDYSQADKKKKSKK